MNAQLPRWVDLGLIPALNLMSGVEQEDAA